EQPLHVLSERADHLFPIQLRERKLDLVSFVGAVVENLPPRARDREPLIVKERADLEEDLDLALAVHARPAAPLLGTQHLELRLPVAEHVRFDANQITDFADRVVEPSGRKRLHGGYLLDMVLASGLRPRVKSSRRAALALFFS